MRVGPPRLLRRQWLVREIAQQLIPQALLVLLLATLAFALAVAWRERRAANLHFVAVIALWAMLVAVDLTPSLPLSRDASVILVTLVGGGGVQLGAARVVLPLQRIDLALVHAVVERHGGVDVAGHAGHRRHRRPNRPPALGGRANPPLS